MSIHKIVGRNITAAVILSASSGTLFATGFRLPDQDAFATGRGEAFVATADNPSAIYYNPAGISQLEGQNLRGGFYGIYLDPSYQANGSSREFHNQNKLAAVPQLFYTINPKDSILSGGIGLYSPYGLSVRWPQASGFRTVGEQASLRYITLNPVLALKVSDHLSIGGGLTINYASIDLRQGLFWPAQKNDGFKFRGEGWDVGYNLGGLVKLNDHFSLGASFRSGTEPNLKGHVSDHNSVALPGIPTFRERSAANATLPTPLNAIFGISFRPTEHWNFEFDADYTGWNSLQTVVIHQQDPSIVLPQNIPVTFNWQPTWYYEFGGTRYFDNGWHVSAGYIFNENAMPDAHYTPLVADQDRHFFSAGVGHKGTKLNFDVAYQFGYGPSRKVSGSGTSPAGQTADGTYSFISHAVIGSVGLNF
jgi:long-chain fatty acid transport protein